MRVTVRFPEPASSGRVGESVAESAADVVGAASDHLAEDCDTRFGEDLPQGRRDRPPSAVGPRVRGVERLASTTCERAGSGLSECLLLRIERRNQDRKDPRIIEGGDRKERGLAPVEVGVIDQREEEFRSL